MSKTTIKTGNSTVNGISIFTGNVEKAQALLEKHNKAILKAETNGYQAIINIAGNLNAIAESKAYALEDCKGIGEYAEKHYNYKKSTVSDYCKVASLFLKGTNKVNTSFTCTLPCIDGNMWTVGQLKELTRICKDSTDSVFQLITDGVIDSTMSAHDLREKVQAITQKPADDTADDTADVTAVDTADKSNVANTAKNDAILKFKESNPDSFKFCEKLLKKVGKLYLAIPEAKRIKNVVYSDTMNEIRAMIQTFCIDSLDDVSLNTDDSTADIKPDSLTATRIPEEAKTRS